MDSFLSVQPGLLVWSIINFILFLLVLYLIGGKSFIKNIINRESYIQEAINSAESQKQTMEQLIAANEKKLLEAQKNIDELVRKAKDEAQIQAQQIIDEAKKSRDTIVGDAKSEIERNKKLAIQEIRSEVAELVVIATEKLLNEKLDKDKDKALINTYLHNMSKN